MNRDYMINGEPVDERTISTLFYSSEEFPSEAEIRERLGTHFTEGFGATSVEVPVVETFDHDSKLAAVILIL